MNNHYSNSCGCEQQGMSPAQMPAHMSRKDNKSLAMAFVQWQKWQNVMDGCSGLKHGTIFEDLVMPFEGTKAACASCGRNDKNYNNYNNYNRRGMR